MNIDWLARTGLSAADQQAEFLHWLDVAEQFNLNAVFVQVRPTADAFWPSPLEPWSRYLTGVQGQDPAYDPLAFIVEEARRRNLERHAWYNPYRVSMGGRSLGAGARAPCPSAPGMGLGVRRQALLRSRAA